MSSAAGRRVLVKVTGDAVTFTDQACGTTDHKTYQITSTTRRVWDRTVAIAVKVDGVLTAEVYTIDRLRGLIVFATTDALRGAVTVSGSSLPTATAVGAKSFKVELSCAAVDDTDFDTAGANGGYKTCIAGMFDATGSIGRHQRTGDSYVRDAITAGEPVVVEIYLDRNDAAPLVCVWALFEKDALQSAVDGNVDADLDFQSTTDADGRAVSLA